MSDTWIRLIPKDPNFIPDDEAISSAKAFFMNLFPDADEIRIHKTDEIRFYDCGSNFERVGCPECGQELDEIWWQERMSEDWNDGFSLKEGILPCCGVKKDLNALIYDWDQGFARFGLDAMNLGVIEIRKEDFEALENILKCRLKQIRQHL